jgi:NAD(P)-dependent dehydrogenase (short-subunit alcohol dehydrogenase family)
MPICSRVSHTEHCTQRRAPTIPAQVCVLAVVGSADSALCALRESKRLGNLRVAARRFVDEGMRVALADAEPEALQRAFTELNDDGATVIAVPTDVSNADAVEQLAACGNASGNYRAEDGF